MSRSPDCFTCYHSGDLARGIRHCNEQCHILDSQDRAKREREKK